MYTWLRIRQAPPSFPAAVIKHLTRSNLGENRLVLGQTPEPLLQQECEAANHIIPMLKSGEK